MKTLPPCILYTRDAALADRLSRLTDGLVDLRQIQERDLLEQHLVQIGDAVLLADLRAPDCLELLADIRNARPLSISIVLGTSRSDPMLAAEWLDPFSVTDLEPDRREFRILMRHAVECFTLRQKSHLLEQELTALNARRREPAKEVRGPLAGPLHHFSKAQRNVDNLEVLFDSVIDGLVDAARVTRAGIFIRPEAETEYLFRAGTRCLSITRALTFKPSHPFVVWLESRGHLVARQTLTNVEDPQERAMLKQVLDALAAEVIIPLHAGNAVRGWIFVGRRATGLPFEITDLEDLAGLSDHISTTLEKALKYNETALQKTLAETLLHSIPFGIAACDSQTIIRWFNSTANDILKPPAPLVIGQAAEVLGSRVADLLHRTLEGEGDPLTAEWTDPRTKRTLSAETRQLLDEGRCVGAMMMMHDITGARLLQEKEEQLERAAFWTELASSMSHEIRNPLVAIKTFAQLLPNRYDDEDFRAEFGEQVSAEIDRLNQIVEKINGFAELPRPVLSPIDVRRPIESAVTRLQSDPEHEHLSIHLASDDSALKINGDTGVLEECFYHLLRNAAENLGSRKDASIRLRVKSRAPENAPPTVYVLISDNGSGIDASVRDKLFSPFSTTKARGLGLGLPIAKRAVIDHNGRIEIDTGDSGTTITIAFPALAESDSKME